MGAAVRRRGVPGSQGAFDQGWEGTGTFGGSTDREVELGGCGAGGAGGLAPGRAEVGQVGGGRDPVAPAAALLQFGQGGAAGVAV